MEYELHTLFISYLKIARFSNHLLLFLEIIKKNYYGQGRKFRSHQFNGFDG